MPLKIVIVKLAAIGDVVMACRAINDWYREVDTELELHWIIDRGLKPLAERLLLLKKVHWKTIDSSQIFQGSFAAKAREALKISKYVAKIRPDHVVLLHRDKRYRYFLRPTFRGTLVCIEENQRHEIDVYSAALAQLGLNAGVRSVEFRKDQTSATKNRIGVLIGGAKNQKLTYREKRWPHIKKFILALNELESTTIVLYGSNDDLPEAEEVLNVLPNPSRVENNVGRLSLDELPNSFLSLESFVSIDSGLAHIASMVMDAPSQRVVVLFGPTSPDKWAPRPSGQGVVEIIYEKVECSPCYKGDGNFVPCLHSGEKFQKCMSGISVSDVIKAVVF